MLLFNKPTAISYISKSGDKIYPIVIDIKEGVKSSEILSFMTADSNSGILSVVFMEGETIYNIDDATVICDIERPDGTDLSIGAVKVADGVVEVPLGVNGTSQPGMYMFDFKIIRPESKTIGVPLVSYTVTQSINADEIVTQDDRLPILNDLVVKIQNATSASTQATNECKTAINNSIQVTDNVTNAMKSINNAIASGTVDLELKQLRTSLNGIVHPTANDRINQMETHLLDTTSTTIETERKFTTVDATNNGYFEDVKLEGKTLVNLIKDGNVQKNLGKGKATLAKYSYNRMLDVDKMYTFICKVSNVEEKGDNRPSISFNSGVNGSGIRVDSGLNILTFKNNVSLVSDNQLWIFYSNTSSVTSTKPCVDYVLILEGDHTNNPPEYFEGLVSIGQDVEEFSVESSSAYKDILYRDGYVAEYNANGHIVSIAGGSNMFGEVVKVKPNTSYTVKFNENSTFNPRIYGYTYTPKCPVTTPHQQTILQTNSLDKDYTVTFTTLSNVNYLFIGRYDGKEFNTNYQLKYASTGIEVTFNKDKKPLLYYNPTTKTWEKPVLREWDTIEKHSDGKYYYHKRSGEVVLNGSESWVADSIAVHTTVNRYFVPFPKAQGLSRLFCDNFTVLDTTNINVEGVLIGSDKSIYCNIAKSKLSIQDVEGFKAWLKANPTTIVYQLVQEEIYECINIDLMTYNGETNYIINSGAISPKSTLKVHNNIPDVVKVLQEKVSLLENTFIAGLKSVLSGDMYSLATLLYPEDFEQNDNIEQDIMVIPE